MSYFSKFEQNVKTSTLNSSNQNLDALGTFTGLSETTLGVAGIKVSLYATQNCTVYVDQSPDGTNWDLTDTYNYRYKSATDHNFGVTTQTVSSYFRVRVKNISSTLATTTFRLQTALCPIVEAVPRTLSEEGNLKVGIYEIEDEVGSKVRISPNGALKTYTFSRLIGVSFIGTTIDSSFWSSAVSNNGSGVQTGGQFEMRTITAPATSSPNGASALQSQRTARYINGVPNVCRIQADYGGAAVANNTKRWGCFTGTAGAPTDGAMFELINGTQSIATYKAGTPTRVSNGSFNGDYGATLNNLPSGVQTFEIVYNNRYVYFYFNNILVHQVEGSTATWTDTLSLPCRAENYNTGNSTTDTSLKIRSFIVARMGNPTSRPQWANITNAVGATILRRGAGCLHKIVVNSWTTGATCSVYDALSATNPIALITLANAGNGYSLVPISIPYDLDFYTGLTYVTTGTINVTIVYE